MLKCLNGALYLLIGHVHVNFGQLWSLPSERNDFQSVMITLIDSNRVGGKLNDATIIKFIFSESDHSECSKCKAGTYSKVPSDSCTPCPSDTVRYVMLSCQV